MNIFKKLWRGLLRKKVVVPHFGEIQILGEMVQCIFHPADMMEQLLMCIAYETREPAFCSLKDIKLYSLYDERNGAFLGSFYALEIDGRYYGNIVGSCQIFSCLASSFRFKTTDEVVAPLKTVNGFVYALRCKYDCKTAKFSVMQLEKIVKDKEYGTVLYTFEKSISFSDAVQFSQMKIGN